MAGFVLHRPWPDDRGPVEAGGRRHIGIRAGVHRPGGRADAVAMPACQPARVLAVYRAPAAAPGAAGGHVSEEGDYAGGGQA
jgi:hypothetical protein